MASPFEGLRKILALERGRKYTDEAIVGGLDRYLLRFVEDNGVTPQHKLSRVIQSLPPGGYQSLHRVQRERVVDELLRAAENGASIVAEVEQAIPPAGPAPAKRRPQAVAPKKAPAGPRTRVAPVVPAVGTIDSPVSVLGLRRPDEQRFRKLGLNTVRDLLFHFPRRYHDYSEARRISDLQFGEEQTVVGKVSSSGDRAIGRQKRKASEIIVNDGTGSIRVIFWNQPWIANRLRPGVRVALSGKVSEFRGRLQMDSPEIDPIDEEAFQKRRLVPVYSSTEGLSQLVIREAARRVVDQYAGALEETLPGEMRRRLGLPGVEEALTQIHFPDSQETADVTRRRFAFEELLHIEVGVVRRRIEWQSAGGAPRLALPADIRDGYISSLPFELTGAQQAAVREVLADISDETPMTRLLEGDVGSGKTVVAGAALLAAVASGHQGAIMAPTEILAEQHFRTFMSVFDARTDVKREDGPWFEQRTPGYVALQPEYMARPLRIALLTGSLKQAEKAATQEAIAGGEVDIVVGTHALLQEGVSFPRLGVAVIDEQHRFGVEQRGALREKGGSPHVLVMTATPIPRTLALTVYGDLDITVLNEMPPGRPKVKTYRVLPYRREEAFDFARKKVTEGRQTYIICPLVEESEAIDARAAVQEYERLSRDVFPDLRLGLLHGRMSSKEKDGVMRAFRDHELDILVSTSVVEVGVDVPNATVILIEGADRFGLSQLHQFRGRVRRSEEQGYCFLLSDNPSPDSEDRLIAMVTTDDGFKLAERDLELRGPGEYFGTRQSGLPDLKVAQLSDVETIMAARNEAQRLLEQDPDLRKPEHRAIAAQVSALWDRVTSEVT